ncbi:MAG: S8 family serine peptidase [Alistipes finegoldii]
MSVTTSHGRIPSGLYGDHGTKVAGVIGATANNGKGIAGVASG